MNIFSICYKKADSHIEQEKIMLGSSRQQLGKTGKNGQEHNTMECGDLIYECVTGIDEDRISGEVYIRRKDNKKLVFEGNFYNNEKNGFGIQYDDYGQILYEGDHKDNKKDGWGVTSSYKGRFREDLYDGWGRLITPEIFYEGYFSQGRFNGLGIYIKSNDELKDVETLANQAKIDEYILLSLEKSPEKLFNDHDLEEIYLGQFTNGLKNGSGKLHKKNGEFYIGQFSYDMYHGNGAYLKDSTAKLQKGVFIKDKFLQK